MRVTVSGLDNWVADAINVNREFKRRNEFELGKERSNLVLDMLNELKVPAYYQGRDVIEVFRYI